MCSMHAMTRGDVPRRPPWCLWNRKYPSGGIAGGRIGNVSNETRLGKERYLGGGGAGVGAQAGATVLGVEAGGFTVLLTSSTQQGKATASARLDIYFLVYLFKRLKNEQ